VGLRPRRNGSGALMSVKFDTVKPGDVLYDYHSYRAGNTTMRRWGNWPVEIVSIRMAPDSSPAVGSAIGAMVIWNGNRPEVFWPRARVARLRRTPGKDKG
jgi:hypothetical protein